MDMFVADGRLNFFACVAAACGLCEVLSRVVKAVLQRGWVYRSLAKDGGRGLKPQAQTDFRDLGPSYVLSMLVAVALGVRGIAQFTALLSAPDAVKMLGVRGAEAVGVVGGLATGQWHAACVGVEHSNILFTAFLLQDLVQILVWFPRLGGVEQILHHVLFLVCSSIGGHYKINFFPFTWLILGELSTILLELRWFLIKLGRGSGPAMGIVSAAFAAVFGICRVLLYPWGAVLFWRGQHLVGDSGAAPAAYEFAVVSLVSSGFVLNLFWFQKILAIALRGGQSAKPTAKVDAPVEAQLPSPAGKVKAR